MLPVQIQAKLIWIVETVSVWLGNKATNVVRPYHLYSYFQHWACWNGWNGHGLLAICTRYRGPQFSNREADKRRQVPFLERKASCIPASAVACCTRCCQVRTLDADGGVQSWAWEFAKNFVRFGPVFHRNCTKICPFSKREPKASRSCSISYTKGWEMGLLAWDAAHEHPCGQAFAVPDTRTTTGAVRTWDASLTESGQLLDY